MNFNKKNILVSIILPAHNSEKYIKKAINSVLCQSYDNFELLIIDDGSTDSTFEICKSITNEKVKIFKIEHKGVSHARNTGLRIAKGEYIKFLDSDDELEENALEILINNADDNDIIFSGFIDTSSGNRYVPSLDKKEYDNYISLINDILYYDFYNNITSIHSIFIKREKVKFYFDENIAYGEDALFNIQNLKMCNSITLLPWILYKYNKNRNANCLTNVFDKNRLYTSYKIFLEFCNGETKADVKKYFIDKFIIRIYNFFIRLNNYQYFSEKEKKDIIKEYLYSIIYSDDRIIKNGSPMKELTYFYNLMLAGNIEELYLLIVKAKHIFSNAPGLVSVIMPVYNMQDTIAKSIESVINQKYTKWELIIIDDGSTDESGKICDKYQEKDVRIKVLHTKNNGTSAARNQGLNYAKGEYVSFIDADDRYDSQMLDTCLLNFDNADLVVFAFESYPINILKIDNYKNIHFDGVPNEEEGIEYFLKFYVFDSVFNKVFRKNKIRFLFDESVDYAEDSIFCMQNIKYMNSIKLIENVLYYYNFNGTKFRKDAAKSLIKRLKTTFSLYYENELLIRKIYLTTIRGIREYIMLLMNNIYIKDNEKELCLNELNTLVNSLGEYDREDFLYEKNKIWWHQIKNKEYENAIKELKEIYLRKGIRIVQ